MRKGSCLYVVVSLCMSTRLTETAMFDRLIRDEVISWAPGDVPDLSPPTKQAADTPDTIPPAKVSDLQVTSFDAATLVVTMTWTAPGDDGNNGIAKRYDLRMAESQAQIQTKFTSSPKVEPRMLLTGKLIPSVPGTTEKITFQIPNKAIWKEYVFALKTFDEANNESPMSVTSPLPYSSYVTTTTTTVAAAVVTKTVSTPRRYTAKQSHQSHMSPPDKKPDVGVIVGGSLCGVAGAAVATVLVVIKVLLKKKAKQQPHPLEAKMTEPSVPRENFVIIS